MKRILYVEDDAGLRELIAAILANEGYAVETSNDGRDGLERIRAEGGTFDLLLTDIRMPIMAGIELVRRLEQTDFKAPIILFSAFDTDLYDREAKGLRIAAKLMKGDIQKLIDTVAVLVAGKTTPEPGRPR